MKKTSKITNGPKLSNFVLGNILKQRDNGLKPKEERTTIGYILPQDELDIIYVYDLISDKVFELNSKNTSDNEVFDVINQPWEKSEKILNNKESKEIVSILEKYREEYLEEKSKIKYHKKQKTRRQVAVFEI